MGKALISVGSVGFAFCSWEGRPLCRPVPVRESLTGLLALGDFWIFMWFPQCPWLTRRSTLPSKIAAPLDSQNSISPANGDELKKPQQRADIKNGGEGGIRTRGTLLRFTSLAKKRFRPLSHFSIPKTERKAPFAVRSTLILREYRETFVMGALHQATGR